MVNRERIDDVITNGIAWLKAQQKANGEYGRWGPGSTSLAVMALLAGGVPDTDPAVANAISYLLNYQPSDSTYFRSLTVMALVASGKKTIDIQDRMQADVEWLVDNQGSNPDDLLTYGAWGYTNHPKVADGSNTHFSLLALKTAVQWGLNVQEEIWCRALSWYQRNYNIHKNGSYVFSLSDKIRLNDQDVIYAMTAGALSSLKIIALLTSDPKVKFKAQELIKKTLEWLKANYVNGLSVDTPGSWHYNYLFSLQKGCVIEPCYTLLGRNNWYYDITDYLMNQQKPEGCWVGEPDKKSTEVIYTSLALISLTCAAQQEGKDHRSNPAEGEELEKSDIQESVSGQENRLRTENVLVEEDDEKDSQGYKEYSKWVAENIDFTDSSEAEQEEKVLELFVEAGERDNTDEIEARDSIEVEVEQAVNREEKSFRMSETTEESMARINSLDEEEKNGDEQDVTYYDHSNGGGRRGFRLIGIVFGLIVMLCSLVAFTWAMFKSESAGMDESGSLTLSRVSEGKDRLQSSGDRVFCAESVIDPATRELFAKVSGAIEQVGINPGDDVYIGQSMMSIDSREIKFRIAQVKAEIEKSQLRINSLSRGVEINIKADFNGVVREVYVQPGEKVTAERPMLTLLCDQVLDVIINETKEEYGSLKEGLPIDLYLPGGEKIEGVLYSSVKVERDIKGNTQFRIQMFTEGISNLPVKELNMQEIQEQDNQQIPFKPRAVIHSVLGPLEVACDVTKGEVSIYPECNGQVMDIFVTEGAAVAAEQVLGRVSVDEVNTRLKAEQIELNRLRDAQHHLEQLLQDYEVVSPLSGKVVTLLVEEGTWIRPDTALALLEDLSHYQVSIPINEEEAALIQPGLPAHLII